MAFTVRVTTEKGEPIVYFSEGYSRQVVESLWRMKRENKIKPESSDCHLEEIYRIHRDIAVPLLLHKIKELIQGLKEYLEEPKGNWDYQKDLFHRYEKVINVLERPPDEILIFDVWDMF